MLALLLVAALAQPSTDALEILERHQCHRCHVVEGLAAPPPPKRCAGCHQEIAATEHDPIATAKGREEYGDAWPRFVRRTSERYCHLPSLTSMGRFQASWLRTFLAAPYDLRPNLAESMIRHAMTADEVRRLVAGWGAENDSPTPVRPPPARLAAGAALFEAKQCGACHQFGNFVTTAGAAFTDPTPKRHERALAPDLRHARDRLALDTIRRWILDPRAVKPDTSMPALGISSDEAGLLTDFVFFAAPGKPAKPLRPKPVRWRGEPTWEAVESQVFRAVCWHCHSDPAFNGGDGGPGNSGGFGFAGAGLSFASWGDVMNGSIGPDGNRRSIFRRGESGEPVLLERLKRRVIENERDFVSPGHDLLHDLRRSPETAPRGMPLGLPALSPAQLSLVEQWIAAGHPGPR